MTFWDKAKNFYHASIVNRILLGIAVVGAGFGIAKYNNTPQYKDRDLYVKGKHTEMRIDPNSGKKYEAYIIESKHGNFDCDGSATPFNAASRRDAKARYDALELYHDYEITTVRRGIFGDPAIVNMRNVQQKIHLEPFDKR